MHLVEPMPADESDPLENYRVIRAELKQHDERLGQRPEIVVVSKAELPGAEEVCERLASQTGGDVLLISAVTGQGLNQLVRQAEELLAAQRQPVA